MSGNPVNCSYELGKENQMFENVINEEAIDALTEEQVDEILAILTKAGY